MAKYIARANARYKPWKGEYQAPARNDREPTVVINESEPDIASQDRTYTTTKTYIETPFDGWEGTYICEYKAGAGSLGWYEDLMNELEQE